MNAACQSRSFQMTFWTLHPLLFLSYVLNTEKTIRRNPRCICCWVRKSAKNLLRIRFNNTMQCDSLCWHFFKILNYIKINDNLLQSFNFRYLRCLFFLPLWDGVWFVTFQLSALQKSWCETIIPLNSSYIKTPVCALHEQDPHCKLEEKFEITNFELENKSYSVLFFQRVQVPCGRTENPNH